MELHTSIFVSSECCEQQSFLYIQVACLVFRGNGFLFSSHPMMMGSGDSLYEPTTWTYVHMINKQFTSNCLQYQWRLWTYYTTIPSSSHIPHTSGKQCAGVPSPRKETMRTGERSQAKAIGPDINQGKKTTTKVTNDLQIQSHSGHIVRFQFGCDSTKGSLPGLPHSTQLSLNVSI